MSKALPVEIQMEEIIGEVSKNVEGAMKTGVKQTALEAARRLRESSPKGPDGYAKGWKASKRRGGSEYVVHNATHYQLTHLLENSHVIANKKGEYGSTSPGRGQVVHIKPVAEQGAEDLVKNVMEDLEL